MAWLQLKKRSNEINNPQCGVTAAFQTLLQHSLSVLR
jgi:hypothetical protein